jgi:hypothetical protein
MPSPRALEEKEDPQPEGEEMAQVGDVVLVDALNTELREDPDLQSWLQKRLFRAGDDEFFLLALPCSSFRFMSSESERNSVAILSTCQVYVLTILSGTPLGQAHELIRGSSLQVSFDLAELRSVVIGPIYQYFRLESKAASQVIVTRAHERTHWFIDMLLCYIRRPSGGDGDDDAERKPCQVVHAARSTTANFTKNVLRTKANKNPALAVISLYVHVRSRASEKRWNPRVLIATQNRLYLCAEDLTRWPLSPAATTAPQQSPQFLCAKEMDIADLSGVTVTGDLAATIEADAEVATGKRTHISLSVEFGSQKDLAWTIDVLQRLFFAIMKVTIDVKRQQQ